MNDSNSSVDIRLPVRVLIEHHAGDPDARDIIVEMEDGTIYTAMFATLDHLKRQMSLTYDLCSHLADIVPTRFAVVDTPHIIVERLDRETIEDTIDSLLALETFATVFTQVTEDEATTTATTNNGSGSRATQEVAAVVLSDVLVVES